MALAQRVPGQQPLRSLQLGLRCRRPACPCAPLITSEISPNLFVEALLVPPPTLLPMRIWMPWPPGAVALAALALAFSGAPFLRWASRLQAVLSLRPLP